MRLFSRLPIAAPVSLTRSTDSAELSEFFSRSLANEGYSGCEVRVTHARTEIIIRATHTQEVLGEKGRRIRELTALVQKCVLTLLLLLLPLGPNR